MPKSRQRKAKFVNTRYGRCRVNNSKGISSCKNPEEKQKVLATFLANFEKVHGMSPWGHKSSGPSSIL